jgi:hypothetical protein
MHFSIVLLLAFFHLCSQRLGVVVGCCVLYCFVLFRFWSLDLNHKVNFFHFFFTFSLHCFSPSLTFFFSPFIFFLCLLFYCFIVASSLLPRTTSLCYLVHCLLPRMLVTSLFRAFIALLPHMLVTSLLCMLFHCFIAFFVLLCCIVMLLYTLVTSQTCHLVASHACHFIALHVVLLPYYLVASLHCHIASFPHLATSSCYLFASLCCLASLCSVATLCAASLLCCLASLPLCVAIAHYLVALKYFMIPPPFVALLPCA